MDLEPLNHGKTSWGVPTPSCGDINDPSDCCSGLLSRPSLNRRRDLGCDDVDKPPMHLTRNDGLFSDQVRDARDGKAAALAQHGQRRASIAVLQKQRFSRLEDALPLL
jgi:hypothetical protein